MQLPAASGQITNKTTFGKLSWPAAPDGPSEGSHWCHVFCASGLFCGTKNLTTVKHEGKKHATATLRQLHIPPNVMWHLKTNPKHMKIKTVIISGFLLLTASLNGQKNDELLKQAQDCANNGDYTCAIEATQKLIRKETDKHKIAVYYSNLGTFQRRVGKKENAMKSYDQAIKADPSLIMAYTNRATLNAQIGYREAAFVDYDSALKLDSLDETALINRASLYDKMGEYDQAANDLSKIITADPKNYKARSNLALTKSHRGNLEEALNDFAQLIVDYPTEAILHNNKADILMKLNRYDEALQEVDMAIFLDEKYVTAQVTKGEILMKLGKVDEAKIQLDLAVKLGYPQADADKILINK
jgi:tetratricopeptide (TPR) repeat protein